MKRIHQTQLAALCLALVSCGGTDDTQYVSAPVKVKVERAAAVTKQSSENYSGTVTADNETSVSFPVAGTVKRIYAEVGQRVTQGQLLAEIDDTSIRSSYEAAAATLAQARDAHARMQQLHERGSLPEIQWVEVESKLQQAESMERIARKNLDDCRLTAPFNGVIAERAADPGQNVLPGMTVVKLATIDRVKVRISVPESEISSIKQGCEASISVPALGGETFTGRVVEKGVTANPLSHAYEVKMTVNNQHGRLLPGMVTRVSLADSTQTSFILPAQALLLGEKGSAFVWVNDNGTAARRTVVCGDPTPDGITVASGLAEGDEVIVEGQHKISEGMRLEIIR